MKKMTLFLCLLSFLTASGSGQRHYVGLSFGGSIPGEEFAAKSLQEDGGYALPGFVVDFSGAYIFDYYLGLAGSFTFSSNPPDRTTLGEDLKEAIPGLLPADAEVVMRMQNWLYANLMAGPILTIPAWKLNFDIRGLAGLGFLMSPPWELSVISGEDEYFERHGKETVNFAYMLGTGIRFNVNSNYAIRMSCDYYRSRPSFTVDENGLVSSITGKSSYDMNVATLNISLGIAYRF
jgi:opacity protein-like surface antigen